MSENKCPCCGCPMKETHLGFVCPADNCAFRCSTNSLPRVAAAMDARSRHNALVEAVKKMETALGRAYIQCPQSILDEYSSARSDVDRLIGEGDG